MKSIKIFKPFVLAALAGVTLFSSCKKDVENPAVTLEQRKAGFNQSADQITADLKSLSDADAFTAIANLMSLMDGGNGGIGGGKAQLDFGKAFTKAFSEEAKKAKQEMKEKAIALSKSFIPKQMRVKDHEFDFEANKGVYDWSQAKGEFVKTGPSDFMILNFPADEKAPANLNASITITDYKETHIVGKLDRDTWIEATLPTLIAAKMTVNGKEAARLAFKGVWNDKTMPIETALDMAVEDFTYTASLKNPNNTVVSVKTDLSKAGKTLVGQDFTLLFKGREMQSASGYVQYVAVKIEGSIDAAALGNFDDEPTAEQINQHIKLAVYTVEDGGKIGDVKAKLDAKGELTAVIVFTDGTEQNLEDYLAPIVAEIEDMMEGWG